MSEPKAAGDEVPPGTEQSAEAPCRRCHGSGTIENAPCPDCNGTGTVTALVGDA